MSWQRTLSATFVLLLLIASSAEAAYVNLAAKSRGVATFSASSTYNDFGNCQAAKYINDGYWYTPNCSGTPGVYTTGNQSTGSWMQYTFNGAYTIDKIKLSPTWHYYRTAPRRVTLLFSDGSSYVIADTNMPYVTAHQQKTFAFPARTVRWIRWRVDTVYPSGIGWNYMSYTEWEVYGDSVVAPPPTPTPVPGGVNIARASLGIATFTASSTYNDGGSWCQNASYINDGLWVTPGCVGTPGVYTTGNQSTGSWMQYTFNNVYLIDTIRLSPTWHYYRAAPKRVTLLFSDGSSYVIPDTNMPYLTAHQVKTFTFPARATRWIRWRVDSAYPATYGWNYMSYTEWEVYTAGRATPVSNPPVADAGGDRIVPVTSDVTLDGSASTDPDGDMPLTYEWTLLSVPSGSIATLTGATTATPSFNADQIGAYTVRLVVTDNKGLTSAPVTVTITADNNPPVADAGIAQTVHVGSTVYLDGSASSDPDGHLPLAYQWTLLATPAGSWANLSNSVDPTPFFVADMIGDYVFDLTVTDSQGLVGAPSQVTVTATNTAPVADVNNGITTLQGVVTQPVTLDGSLSYDPDGDPLTWLWSFTTVPAGSAASMLNPVATVTTFTPDLAGIYVARLVVNDPWVGSAPYDVTVTVITQQQQVTNQLTGLTTVIPTFNPALFSNKNHGKTLVNKLNAALGNIAAGNYALALDQLQLDILLKTDGCAVNGVPDKQDWIVDCPTQGVVYPVVTDAIALLLTLI